MLKFRLLPLVIFVAAMLLTVRVNGIWGELSDQAGLTVASATAEQEQKPGPLTPERLAQAAPQAEADRERQPESTGTAAEPVTTPAATAGDVLADITRFSQSELDLLQALGERRAKLEQREAKLAERESMLKAAETRIDQKIDELKSVQSKIEALVRENDDKKNADMDRLARIYETMKPKQAAKIFEELDQFVLIEVAQRMKNRALAPILAAMDPLKARALTGELARLRELPGFELPGSSEGASDGRIKG